MKDLFVISFSGGRSSAFMTLEILKDEYIRNNSIVIFANTGKEAEATLVFVMQVSALLYKLYKKNVVWVEYAWKGSAVKPTNGFRVVNFATASRKGEPFEQLIRKKRYVPNVVTRYCTTELKIRVIKKYILSLGYKHWDSMVGIRFDEPKRWMKIAATDNHERWETVLPMVKWKTVKQDVLDYWKTMPFDLQLKEHEGNCDLCHLKGINKKRMLIRTIPEIADWWIKMEDLTGATFKKEISVRQIKDKVNSELPFLEFDDTIDCFCNID
jgi:3'-phosphoadenosine 5'-phosphosulfate sulfotransferase (PAPS reductase)/FAD synthetase